MLLAVKCASINGFECDYKHQLFKVNMIQCILKVHTAASLKSGHSRRTVIQASAAVCCNCTKVLSKYPLSGKNEEEEGEADGGCCCRT